MIEFLDENKPNEIIKHNNINKLDDNKINNIINFNTIIKNKKTENKIEKSTTKEKIIIFKEDTKSIKEFDFIEKSKNKNENHILYNSANFDLSDINMNNIIF